MTAGTDRPVPDGWTPPSPRGVDDGLGQPPHEAYVERSVIGAVLLSQGRVISDVEPHVTGRDFYQPAHETIWDTALAMWGQGEPVDYLTVANVLARRGDLERVGGYAYLHSLVESTPSVANAVHYATLVAERAVVRRLDRAGTKIRQIARSSDGGDAATLVAAAQAEIEQVASGMDAGGALNLGERVDVIYDRYENPRPSSENGLTWGWVDMDGDSAGRRDGLLRPMSPGQFIVVSARPGVGKSTLVRGIAAHVACDLRKRVVLHALEQSAEETEDCLVAAIAGVSHKRLLDGSLDERDWTRLAKARDLLDGADLVIDDSPRLTLPGLLTSVRRHRADLAIVDQLQLMEPPPNARSTREAVDALSDGLKKLARAEEIPLIAVSKMNRGPEARTDKRPMMSDLRESGNIESDADVILLLHREDQYEKESPRVGEVDVIVAKQRRGSPGTVVLANQLHYQRFVDCAVGS